MSRVAFDGRVRRKRWYLVVVLVPIAYVFFGFYFIACCLDKLSELGK